MQANQWQKINATGDAPSPRYGHTMGWSSDAGLYVFGGRQLFVDGGVAAKCKSEQDANELRCHSYWELRERRP